MFQRVDNQVAASEGPQHGRAAQEGPAPSTPWYMITMMITMIMIITNKIIVMIIMNKIRSLMVTFTGFGDEEYYALYGTPEQYQRYRIQEQEQEGQERI